MLNATIPPDMAPQCKKDGGPQPATLTLTDGVSAIVGTREGKYRLLDQPLKGRFHAGGPEYVVLAYRCIGDGNYWFTGMSVIDASSGAVQTTPAYSWEALNPLAEQVAPGQTWDGSGEQTFSAPGGVPTLSGTWRFVTAAKIAGYPGQFQAEVWLAQATPNGVITQQAQLI